MNKRDKVLGMFLGIYLGDALGFPVEGWKAEKIAKEYGRLDRMIAPDKHKWFKGNPSGIFTDDTYLTLTVAEGIMAGGFSMDAQVAAHLAAHKESTLGWGGTTRRSLKRLSEGAKWEDSGIDTAEVGADAAFVARPSGMGNGVPMKIGPVAATLFVKRTDGKKSSVEFIKKIASATDLVINLSQMTHRTSMSASAGLAHLDALTYCFSTEEFKKNEFVTIVAGGSLMGESIFPETIVDRITNRFEKLMNHDLTTESIINDFGGGSCYVYDSLPFTYAYFLRNPNSFESVIDCINGGGDTDSNASMLGGLLGALHGTKIFPESAFIGADAKSLAKVVDTANRFCDYLGVETWSHIQ